MLTYQTTPCVEIVDELLEAAGVRVYVKREDLNHSLVSGNKWWKLKYNLLEAKELGADTILTFGGAYSNHVYATSAAAKETGFRSIGVIRGEEVIPYNPTLRFAKSQGMQLHFVSRQTYREKTSDTFIKQLRNEFGDFYLIPEGGSNANAVKGSKEFASNILSAIDSDIIILPVGTGGTIAGLICGLPTTKEIIGVSVLRGGEFLAGDIRQLATTCVNDFANTNWKILTDHHHGGYAKSSSALDDFIRHFFLKHGIPLEPVYSGKTMWALWKEISAGKFERGTKILFLHTGGVQHF